MNINDIIKSIDLKIPKELALADDNIGYYGSNKGNIEISKISVIMDITPDDDKNSVENELFVSHHPPNFIPNTPTYVVHSNWDIIDGGANDALANVLNLTVLKKFDLKNEIGCVCSSDLKFDEFLKLIQEKLLVNNIKVVNPLNRDDKVHKVATVSGFGLNNLDYIKLAKSHEVDIFLSGDLTHNGAILAKKLGICLIDASHHRTEMPGLCRLCEIVSEIGIPTCLIDRNIPWDNINMNEFK